MSKYFLVAAALGFAACGDRTADVPPVDTTTAAPAPMMPDTTVRDTTDTTQTARDTSATTP